MLESTVSLKSSRAVPLGRSFFRGEPAHKGPLSNRGQRLKRDIGAVSLTNRFPTPLRHRLDLPEKEKYAEPGHSLGNILARRPPARPGGGRAPKKDVSGLASGSGEENP